MSLFSSTPPSKTDHHWVRWADTGHEFTTKVGGTDDYPNRDDGRDPDMEFGPRIPSPEELEATGECVKLLREGSWVSSIEVAAALARLDAIREGT